jgi:hypothetical protein
MVKPKTGVLQFFTERPASGFGPLLPVLSILTFICSWLGAFPASLVERLYARMIFPQISHAAGRLADLLPFSWLDLTVPVGVLLVILLLWRRKWLLLANLVAGLYLIFFWTWALNYHRQPLSSKLQLDSTRMQSDAMAAFATHAAAELNRLYTEKQKYVYNEERTRAEAVERVRRVVAVLDKSDWPSAGRIKNSRIGNPWLHVAGIDGVFNPIPHEPVISNTLLDVERPFVISHELAHVRGYPDEGDANVIATFATLMSDDPAFQYSGWLSLWLYIRTPDLEKLAGPGPREDVRRIFRRAQAEQIRWINDFQRVVLDWFLKANSVQEGVRSYSRVVLVAAGTEPIWGNFR